MVGEGGGGRACANDSTKGIDCVGREGGGMRRRRCIARRRTGGREEDGEQASAAAAAAAASNALAQFELIQAICLKVRGERKAMGGEGGVREVGGCPRGDCDLFSGEAVLSL